MDLRCFHKAAFSCYPVYSVHAGAILKTLLAASLVALDRLIKYAPACSGVPFLSGAEFNSRSFQHLIKLLNHQTIKHSTIQTLKSLNP